MRRDGGPFAALAVKDGVAIADGANQGRAPAIPRRTRRWLPFARRAGCLESFNARGCDFYASCKRCLRWLGAIYWAWPARIFFAAAHNAAAAGGFDDAFICRELTLPPGERSIPMIRVADATAILPFAEWRRKADRTKY